MGLSYDYEGISGALSRIDTIHAGPGFITGKPGFLFNATEVFSIEESENSQNHV
jgi:hypothetical protein